MTFATWPKDQLFGNCGQAGSIRYSGTLPADAAIAGVQEPEPTIATAVTASANGPIILRIVGAPLAFGDVGAEFWLFSSATSAASSPPQCGLFDRRTSHAQEVAQHDRRCRIHRRHRSWSCFRPACDGGSGGGLRE